MGAGAFEALKALQFGGVGAGAVTAKYLADQGAAVVCVESGLSPDPLRAAAPFAADKPGLNRSGSWAFLNANKYSIVLDLKHPQGLEIAEKLVSWADVVIENFTPGAMERLGLGYQELSKINPGLVMVRASIQGQTGPHHQHPGYGIVAAALSGLTNLTGWPDRIPSQPFAGYTDMILPRFAATALVAALLYRRRTGKGQCLDISQFETTLQFIAPTLWNYMLNGREDQRRGNQCDFACPHGAYRCKGEDRWCTIAVFTDEEWQAFCEVLGKPGWTKEPRFATLVARKENETDLDKLVEEWTIGFTPEQVMTMMQAAGVAAGVVETARDQVEDPQLRYREHLWLLNHKEMGPFHHLGQAFKLSSNPAQVRAPAPCLGEHTEHVCTHFLGMSDDEFVELFNAGIFK